jgi:drug/metabolite transporter (DMT)-like permease
LAIPFLKEKISNFQLLALAMLIVSIFLFNPPLKFVFDYGEILVLLATLLWAVENIVAKIVLHNVSSLVVAWGRMFFGSVFLLIYLFFSGSPGQLFIFSGSKIFWLFLSGFILFGYVVSWYRALQLAPATAVSAILVMAVPITIFLDSIFARHLNKSFILPTIIAAAAIFIFTKFFENFIDFLERRFLHHGRGFADVC